MGHQMRLMVVDGNWVLHRVFYTLKTSRPIEQALPWNFTSLICKDALAVRATHLLVAFDGPDIFRYKVYPDYKSGRSDVKTTQVSDDVNSGDIYQYLPAVREFLSYGGIQWVQPRIHEADDVLVTMGTKWIAKFPDSSVVLSTKDKDVNQALRKNVVMYDSSAKPVPKKTRKKDVEAKKGVKIKQLVDYQTLIGDKIDSIPSLMGPVTAAKLLRKYGTLKAFGEKAKGDERIWFEKNKAQLTINRKLVRLVTDCSVPVKVDQLKVPKLVRSEMPTTWYSYQSFLYPKTKGLF